MYQYFKTKFYCTIKQKLLECVKQIKQWHICIKLINMYTCKNVNYDKEI